MAEQSDIPGRVPAVLETSFWIAAYRAEVAANILDFFALVVPTQVEQEILARTVDQPRREYPYATLFRRLRAQLVDPPANAPAPLPIFGAGEAAAITLANQLQIPLLINEHRAAAYARNAAIPIVTVPSFVVALRAQAVISDRAARRKLALIAPITAAGFIADAIEILDHLT